MTTPNVKGIPLVLAGISYVLPPASLATLEDLGPRLDALNTKMAGASTIALADFGVAADLVTECLRRNYPEIQRKDVAQNIGLENLAEVIAMCYDTSGLLRKKFEADALKLDPINASTAQEGGTLGESTGTPLPLIS